MNSNPLVSVCLVTYNHERYIEGCVQSILTQQSTFPIEICIGEDGSSDSTGKICDRLQNQFPDKIRLFHRSRKDVVYVNGHPTANSNFIKTFTACEGEFIALMDGDDYWIDGSKIQAQVDFLQNHPNLAGCFTDTIYVDENNTPSGTIRPNLGVEKIFSASDLIVTWPINTSSFVFRKSALPSLPEWTIGLSALDRVIAWLCAMFGEIGYLPVQTTCYRVHSHGISMNENYQGIGSIENELHLLKLFNTHSGKKFAPAIAQRQKKAKKMAKKFFISTAGNIPGHIKYLNWLVHGHS